MAVLNGELAVPCYLQSAKAGLNSYREAYSGENELEERMMIDGFCAVFNCPTPSDPEGSSGKQLRVCLRGACLESGLRIITR